MAKVDKWEILGVPEETKRKVKAYAVMNGLSISEALTELVNEAIKNS